MEELRSTSFIDKCMNNALEKVMNFSSVLGEQNLEEHMKHVQLNYEIK